MKPFLSMLFFATLASAAFAQTWRVQIASSLLSGPGRHAVVITDEKGRIALVEQVENPPPGGYPVQLPAHRGQQLLLTILREWTDEKEDSHLQALTFANPPSRISFDYPQGLPDWEGPAAIHTDSVALHFKNIRKVDGILISGVPQQQRLIIGGLKLKAARLPATDLYIGLRANEEEDLRYYYLPADSIPPAFIDFTRLQKASEVKRVTFSNAPSGSTRYSVLAVNEQTENPCYLVAQQKPLRNNSLFVWLPDSIRFYAFEVQATFYGNAVQQPAADQLYYFGASDTLPSVVELPEHPPRFSLQSFNPWGFSLQAEDTTDVLHALYRLDAGGGDTLSSWHVIGPAAALRSFNFPQIPREALPGFSAFFQYKPRSARFELLRLADRAHLDFWDTPSRFLDPFWLKQHGILARVGEYAFGQKRSGAY